MEYQLLKYDGGGAAGAAESLTSAADIHTWTITTKCRVIRSGFTITTLTVSSANIVVELDRLPYNNGTREAAFAQLTIPTAAVVGTVYYEDPSSAKYLYEGDRVAVQVATAAAGGGAAGAGVPWLLVEYVPEVPGNNAYMTAC